MVETRFTELSLSDVISMFYHFPPFVLKPGFVTKLKSAGFKEVGEPASSKVSRFTHCTRGSRKHFVMQEAMCYSRILEKGGVIRMFH